jgi:hypothetical protein
VLEPEEEPASTRIYYTIFFRHDYGDAASSYTTQIDGHISGAREWIIAMLQRM